MRNSGTLQEERIHKIFLQKEGVSFLPWSTMSRAYTKGIECRIYVNFHQKLRSTTKISHDSVSKLRF
jgi:hypothetical protein